jgi:hypothetical protein
VGRLSDWSGPGAIADPRLHLQVLDLADDDDPTPLPILH